MINIALYEPDIPQNTGSILRLATCLGVHVDIIEPCGFIFGGSHMKRSGMDYIKLASYKLHPSWEEFAKEKQNSRIILATTKGSTYHTKFSFKPNDTILFGKESAGLPEDIHQKYPDKVKIKMNEHARSLNIAISCGIIVSEALRQIDII